MLKVKDLTVLHPTGQELLDVSLTVAKGELTAVIGPNHSGKSLLGRLIADPAIERKGDVIISHANSQSDPEKAVLQLGYAAAEPQSEQYLTGYEQLDFLGSLFGLNAQQRSKEIIKLCQNFEFSSTVYSMVETMAPAQKKILSLIGSLIHRPNCVIWDEPTGHLDPGQIQLVKQVVKQLKDDKVSILVITNDLHFAQEVADELVIINNGEVLMSGNLKQLKSQTGSKTNDLEEIYRLAISSNG